MRIYFACASLHYVVTPEIAVFYGARAYKAPIPLRKSKMNTTTTSSGSLVYLSTQLLEESMHDHPASLAPDHCPSCWTRKMALELIEYMRQAAPKEELQAA